MRYSSLRNFIFERFEFWFVQSSITHNVAVHVHVLWPVCAHTIPLRMLFVRDDMKIYINKYFKVWRYVNVYEYVFAYVYASV